MSRVTVADAMSAWPALIHRDEGLPYARPLFLQAAAVAALEQAGFLPGDEDAEAALAGRNSYALKAVLRRVGTPLSRLADKALDGRASVRIKALSDLAPAALPWLQQALFTAWEALPYPVDFVSLLLRADPRDAVRATAAIAREIATTPPQLRAVDLMNLAAPYRAMFDPQDLAALQRVSGQTAIQYEVSNALIEIVTLIDGFLITRTIYKPVFIEAVTQLVATKPAMTRYLPAAIRAAVPCPELVP